MEFAAELQASLREFTASGIVEVHENGGRVAPFSGMSWEVRGAGEMPLLHLWSEQFNLTRRVLAITDHSERRLALAVERFGRSKPDRLEFIRRDFDRSASELYRVEFCDRLARLLAEQFPMKLWSRLPSLRTWSIPFPETIAADFFGAAPLGLHCWRCRTVSPPTRLIAALPLPCSGWRARASQTGEEPLERCA